MAHGTGLRKTFEEERERIANEASLFRDLRFPGFDGNYESELMGVARFFIDKMHRFEHFKGRELNSHHPTVSWYSSMPGAFLPMRSSLAGASVSGDQLIAILKTVKPAS